jgi:hypothetical protein
MSDPTLPPPPSNLAPPPGYAAYESTNWQSQLRRIGGLAKAIMILLAVAILGQIVNLATSATARDAAREYLRTRDEDAFTDELAANAAGGLLFGAAQIAIIVISMIWLYRIASNHRTLGRRLTWAPGWAIGGWFLPPLLFVIPLLMLRESWKASAPDVPPGSDEWRNRSDESAYIWAWFVAYSLVPIALMIFGASQAWGVMARDTDDIAEFFDESYGVAIAQGLVTIAGAVTWALVVRTLSRRHVELTGETHAR